MSQPTDESYIPPKIKLERVWDYGNYTYTELFNAISAALSSPEPGALSISVKDFEEAMKRLDK